jgi:hypothetical protein
MSEVFCNRPFKIMLFNKRSMLIIKTSLLFQNVLLVNKIFNGGLGVPLMSIYYLNSLILSSKANFLFNVAH